MLSIDDVTIRYEARTVLRNISLDVKPGEVLALIGPNGVGKSTLIRACSGNLRPIGGRVTIDGHDVQRLRAEDRAKLIAVVPQAVRLPELFSVFDTVLMGRTPYLGWLGREGEKDRSAVQAALDRTGTLELAEVARIPLAGDAAAVSQAGRAAIDHLPLETRGRGAAATKVTIALPRSQILRKQREFLV